MRINIREKVPEYPPDLELIREKVPDLVREN